MRGRVAGKIVLVTGAGSIGAGWGNGKAAAVLYALEGATVVALDRELDAAKETVAIIEAKGGSAVALDADVAVSSDVERAVSKTIEAFGRIDVLHNNVGIVDVGGPVEISEESWDRLMDVNVKGQFLTMKHVIPHMVSAGGGAIVNISSIASLSYLGYPSASYSASKGAVNQLTQNVALQYARKGIRANAILPGLMDTPQIRKYVTSGYKGGVDEMVSQRNELCPTGTMGTAWDVAHAALFLASDEARYITGQCLVVDGGITSRIA